MSYYKGFNEVLSDLLTDHENQTGSPAGTYTRIVYTAVASTVWGLYKFLAWLGKQIFPDTCSSANLDHWAATRGLSRSSGESDASLAARVLADMQQPPAGGNQYDWPRWAEQCSYAHAGGTYRDDAWTEQVSDAWVDEHARGTGTINVLIESDRDDSGYLDEYDAWANATAYTAGDLVKDDGYDGEQRVYVALTSGTSSGTGVDDDSGVIWQDTEGYATSELQSEVDTYLETKRPLGVWDYEVYAVRKNAIDVTMTVAGTNVDTAAVESAIEALIESLSPGQTLYVSQLISVAIEAGADNASVSAPASDFIPTYGPTLYYRCWPGTVSVSAS